VCVCVAGGKWRKEDMRDNVMEVPRPKLLLPPLLKIPTQIYASANRYEKRRRKKKKEKEKNVSCFLFSLILSLQFFFSFSSLGAAE